MTIGTNRIGGTSSQLGGTEPQATHTVQSGQTIQSIASQYQISTETLANHNGIDTGASLTVGQNLVIPQAPAAPEPTGLIAASDQFEVYDPNASPLFSDSFNGVADNQVAPDQPKALPVDDWHYNKDWQWVDDDSDQPKTEPQRSSVTPDELF